MSVLGPWAMRLPNGSPMRAAVTRSRTVRERCARATRRDALVQRHRGEGLGMDFSVRDGMSFDCTNVNAATASTGFGGAWGLSRPANVPSRSLISAPLPSIVPS
jgi:hypothetical protein